jgi:hypothetical protein
MQPCIIWLAEDEKKKLDDEVHWVSYNSADVAMDLNNFQLLTGTPA